MAEKIDTVKVPSEAKYIREISSKITSILVPYGVSDGHIFEIKLCVEEAMRNAMVHGNRSDAGKSVRVSYWIEGGSINIEIEDEGKGFDHKLVADPTQSENMLKTSGRGVYLIKNLMDEVEFSDSGNIIRMTKKLN